MSRIVKFMVAVFEAQKDADKVAKVADGEGLGAVKDARKRLEIRQADDGSARPQWHAGHEHREGPGRQDRCTHQGMARHPRLAAIRGRRPARAQKAALASPPNAARPPAALSALARPFPVHLLPPVPRDYVEATAAAMHCDPSYRRTARHSPPGAAIGCVPTDASPKQCWNEPPYIWACPSASPAPSRAPPYRDVRTPPRTSTTASRSSIAPNSIQYESDLEAWKEAKKESKKGEPDPGPRPRPPVKKAFVKGDVTIEALVGILQDNPRGILIGQDELSAWIGSFVKYAGKTGTSDLPRWLQLHHAGTINYSSQDRRPRQGAKSVVRGVGVISHRHDPAQDPLSSAVRRVPLPRGSWPDCSWPCRRGGSGSGPRPRSMSRRERHSTELLEALHRIAGGVLA